MNDEIAIRVIAVVGWIYCLERLPTRLSEFREDNQKLDYSLSFFNRNNYQQVEYVEPASRNNVLIRALNEGENIYNSNGIVAIYNNSQSYKVVFSSKKTSQAFAYDEYNRANYTVSIRSNGVEVENLSSHKKVNFYLI